MSTNKEFDIIIYGATGFTGRLVAEYLVKQYSGDSSLKWAMAGRSAAKLTQVRDEINAPKNTPLVIADAQDSSSIQAMLNRTKLILTTVGPYQVYGSDLVAMCAKSGVDYVDLCGEPVWMSEMIPAHEKTAQLSGARIVFSCGFDSIPSDMGVYHLQNLAKQQFGKVMPKIRCRVRKMKGTFSGGTAASFKETLIAAKKDPVKMKALLNPFSLTPDYTGAEQPFGNKPFYEEDLGSWVTPFVMAVINTRNVQRSNFLLNNAYGEDFVYDEMFMTGPGEKGEAIANAMADDKSMSGDDGPKPGEGPSKEERESGFYDLLYIGSDAQGNEIKLSVKGDRDPGYGSTSKMIAETAICLVKDASNTKGGIWTTAPAMGDKLIQRLQQKAGLTFTQE
ncbi:saccharopine dehydrogenase family protein [Paraglaciecola marina]|uniref:saccharopine dehydrogenase family protein n=1 Tax=Paraglaciecola marina TaxID=2500157 RepID=UPI00105CFE9F|nr:saccharopine dehydrogenase NADP-binding domain-containing protein [Paraglaciecola marina]